MTDHIKRLLLKDYDNDIRKFELSKDSLKAFGKLKPSSQDLLLAMVEKVGAGLDINDLIIRGDYKNFGFKHKQSFYRCRNELVIAGFILYNNKDHYVNPCMIGYNTKKQLKHFYKSFSK